MLTTSIDLLLPSGFTPPSDPADFDAWLDGRIEAFTVQCRAAMRDAIGPAVRQFFGLTASVSDPAVLGQIGFKWRDFTESIAKGRLTAMHLAGGLNAWVGAEGARNLPATLRMQFPKVINERAALYVAQATNRLANVGEDVWRDVSARVALAVREGMPAEQLKDQVQAIVRSNEFRADTIARTETVGAFVNGDRAGAEALGSYGPVEHSWLATGGNRTRPSHAAADGQTRKFNEPFTVGGIEMMHPHAAGAPAAEVVNCRCVEQHYYPGDTRPDGTIIEESASLPAPAVTDPWQDFASSDLTELRESVRFDARRTLAERRADTKRWHVSQAGRDLNKRITDAGAQVRQRAISRSGVTDEAIEAAWRDLNSIPTVMREARQEAVGRIRDLMAARRDAYVEALSEVRPGFGAGRLRFSNKPRAGTKAAEAASEIDDAARYYPREWLDGAPEHNVGTASRGYVKAWGAKGPEIRLSPAADWEAASPRLTPTAVHELSHVAENANDRIRAAEHSFFWERADRGPAPGSTWARGNENGYNDDWYSQYVGRVYNGAWSDSNYEVLSMGVEQMFGLSRPVWPHPDLNPLMDVEYVNWILGALVAL